MISRIVVLRLSPLPSFPSFPSFPFPLLCLFLLTSNGSKAGLDVCSAFIPGLVTSTHDASLEYKIYWQIASVLLIHIDPTNGYYRLNVVVSHNVSVVRCTVQYFLFVIALSIQTHQINQCIGSKQRPTTSSWYIAVCIDSWIRKRNGCSHIGPTLPVLQRISLWSPTNILKKLHDRKEILMINGGCAK